MCERRERGEKEGERKGRLKKKAKAKQKLLHHMQTHAWRRLQKGTCTVSERRAKEREGKVAECTTTGRVSERRGIGNESERSVSCMC